MNKFVKFAILFFVVVVVVLVGVYFKLYVMGNTNYDIVSVEKVTVSSTEVIIKGNITDSARAYKDYSYTQVGNELYVKVINVLVSNKNSSGEFEIRIPVNGVDINNIHLTDDKTTEVIYSK